MQHPDLILRLSKTGNDRPVKVGRFDSVMLANLLSNDKMHTPALKFNDLREGV